MLLPKGTIVAVADGEKFNLFSNTGDEAGPTLTAMPASDIENVNKGVRREPSEQFGES